MVTNLKIDTTATSGSPMTLQHEAPRETFVGVLRRRNDGENIEQLRAERLARWNELGRNLEATGWHHLEAFLEAASVALDHATHPRFVHEDPGYNTIGAEEAELLADSFVADCRRIVASGGADRLWHMLVTDSDHCAHDCLDRVTAEKLEQNDAHETALLLDSARCFALATFATTFAGADREDARLLFGAETDEYTLQRFAPFAVDNRADDGEDLYRYAAYGFAISRTNDDRLEAAKDYLVGLEAKTVRYDMRPIQRMGFIAWLARNLDVETKGAPS